MPNLIEIIIRASGASQVGGEVGKADKALKNLGKTALGIAGGLGLAVGTRELISFNAEAMQLGMIQKDARNALTSTVGSAASYTRAIDQARVSTRDMVSETELAVGINSLLNMHLASNAQEAAELAMAGATLSKVYASSGATMEKYFRLLSGGALALYDNFSLTSELVSKRRDEIVAATGVSEAEAKLQAIRQLTIEEAKRYNDALSDETVAASQTQAASQDLKAAWGELTNQLIYGSGIAGKAAEGLRGLKAIIEGDSSAQEKHAQDILLAAESYAEYNRAMNQSGLQSERLGKAQFAHVKAALAASDATMDLGSEEIRLAAAADRLAGATAKAATVTGEYTGWAAQARAIQEALGDEYLTSKDNLEDYVNELARASMYGGMSAPSLTNLYGPQQDTSFLDQLNLERVRREREAQEELQQVQLSGARETADRLKSTIEGILGQTTLSEVWQAPADTSRIDENARRLATVATSGFGSEWLAQLNTQFGGMGFWQPIADAMQAGDEGALREAATNLLTGPDVSKLWDIELIKQRVREQLQADNLRQQLVETIQQEMAAEGTAATTVQVGAAMGMEQEAPAGGMDMSPIADQIAGGLSGALPAALEDKGMGATIARAIKDQIEGDEKNMKLVAMAFAERFDDYLPAYLGTSSTVFLETLAQNIADRLGLSTERRP